MTEDELKATSPYAHEVLKADPAAPGGYRAPREGEIVTNWYLANTLRLLGEQGKKGFYEGPVARAIIAATKAKGGFHALEDLALHAEQGSEITEAVPLALGNSAESRKTAGESSVPLKENTINGVTLWEHPPNGQGIVAQIALGIIQELERTGQTRPLTELKHNSASSACLEHLHSSLALTSVAATFTSSSRRCASPSPTRVTSSPTQTA